MLRIFTFKFEERIEAFNDSLLSNFLADKDAVRWECHFFERKGHQYWTVVVEYEPKVPSLPKTIPGKAETKQDEKYKEILTENDWPLFNRLRAWRGEISKKEGIPPYIIFTNIQLAKIAVTRPSSLNALQEIEGIGNAKREKYGKAVLQIISTHGLPAKTSSEEEKNG